MHDVHSWRPLTPMSQVFSSTFKMASMGVFLVISLLLGFALVNGEHLQNTLNLPPRVLLPYVASGSVHTNFSFKVLHGCFVWTSSRPEVASTHPVYNNGDKVSGRKCSKEAILTAQARVPKMQMTEIFGEDEVTGVVLRSDVYVHDIAKIEIVTTTRKLLLGEAPAVCHIQAFDKEGNMFSTLGGLEFEWELKTVEGVGSVNAKSVLRFMQFSFSSYETSPEIYSLEAKGSRGGSIVIEPINTGTAIVKAMLKDTSFANVSPAEARILVLDNVLLVPGYDVYILVNTSVTYSVNRMHRGKTTAIPMPSSQFEFKLSNTTVGHLNVKKSSVLGVKIGYTKVTLVDKNMLLMQAVHQPAVGVHVVDAALLGFSIVPHPDWVLQVGIEYDVTVHIYSHDSRKVFITDNIRIDTSFDPSYFQVLWSSANGSFHHVRTLQKGKTMLTAMYTSIKILGTNVIHTFNNPISGQQEADIFDPVVVNPEIIVFPWYPPEQQKVASHTQFQYLLEPSGGSGMYIWSSCNTSVATVSTKGIVITTNAVGHTQARAADMKNLAIFGTAEVYVLPPRKMEFLPSVVEAQVGYSLSLPLAVATCIYTACQEFHVFTDCRTLPVMYSFSDPSIFKLVEEKRDYEITAGSCMSVKLLALRSGFTTLTVTYQYKDIILRSMVTVGAYHPLKVLDPVDVGVVSLCSAKNLLLEGGPLPWIVDTSGYYEEVIPDPQKEDHVSIGYYPTSDYLVDNSGSYHYFNIICLKQGEQVLTVKIGNKPSAKNPYPASSSVLIRFACMDPASLTIVPDIKLPTVDGRQLSPENCVSSNKEIHVRNNQQLNLAVHLRDSFGRLFDNFTSLTVVWSTSDRTLAEFVDMTSSVKMMFVKYKDDENLRRAMSYQTVSLSDKMGGVVIEASIEGYQCNILRWCGRELKKPVKFNLRGHLKLLLVPERQLVPPAASILNHPENQAVFHIKGGSGHFAVKGSSNAIAKVNYQGKTDILVIPRSEGLFTVMVHDLCLDSTGPAVADVQVSDVYGVDVVVVNKIELYASETLRLKLLDIFGVPLLFRNLEFLTLTPNFTPDILDIRRDFELEDKSKINQDTAYFTVRGLSLGTASLTFTASATGRGKATSDPKDIQVFAPLRLDPRVVVLIRGASFQVRSSGGPSPQAATIFSIANHTVATVSSVGLVEAQQLGTTNLTGFVQTADPIKGQTVLHSKDIVIVHVIQLKGIIINVASTNLVTGTKISMYAAGLNDETPFTFANAVPGLKFFWTSTNPDVCQVKSVYVLSGVAVESENDFRVDLHCINPGQTTVRLRVVITDHSYQQAHKDAVLQDEVTFEVYERLQLIFPANGFLLLPHNVNTKIQTNRDGSARITYEMMTDCSKHNKASSGAAIAGVSRSGQVSTASLSGTAVVLVTVHEEFGINQTAVVHVEVKAVSSIVINCQSPVRTNSDKLHTFPLGMNVLLAVTLHDNIGRRFAVASIPLKYRLNRFDAVHVVPGPENGTFYARAVNLGEAILKVWDPSSVNIADYVRIRVGHGLTPTKATLLLGMVEQFSTSVISEGVGGMWSSSNDKVVSINSTTGMAMATAAGTATIYYKIPQLYSAQTEVKVESLSYIHVSRDDALVITNIPRLDGRGYVIPVNLGHDYLSQEQTTKASGLVDGILLFEELGFKQATPFQCILHLGHDLQGNIHAHDLFEVKPGFVNGQPMCYVVPKNAKDDVIKSASSIAAQLSLVVRIFDEIQGRSESSESLKLPFVPAFVLSETELELSADKRKAQVFVMANAEQLNNLEVRSQDPSLVEFTGWLSSVDKEGEYEIEVVEKNGKSFKRVWVEFKSLLTGQRGLVYVTYTAPSSGAVPVLLPGAIPSSEQCPTVAAGKIERSFQGFLFALLGQTSAWIIGLSFFIGCIILALILCCSPRGRGASSGAVSGAASPSPLRGTPQHGSPYPQGPYPGSSTGTLSAGRPIYLSSTTGAFSPGAGAYGSRGSANDTSPRSFPEEHDETHRGISTTYRHTKTSARTYLSDDSSHASGATSIGRVSPNKSPRLFSINQ